MIHSNDKKMMIEMITCFLKPTEPETAVPVFDRSAQTAVTSINPGFYTGFPLLNFSNNNVVSCYDEAKDIIEYVSS